MPSLEMHERVAVAAVNATMYFVELRQMDREERELADAEQAAEDHAVNGLAARHAARQATQGLQEAQANRIGVMVGSIGAGGLACVTGFICSN